MKLNVPWNNPPIYSRIVLGGSLRGFGPASLSFGVIPFPLVTRIVLLSFEKRTLVGYQPTGMKPSDLL